MIPKLLLFILLRLIHLEITAADNGPCKLKFKLVIISTPDDHGSYAEISPFYMIERLHDQKLIAHEEKNKHTGIDIPDNSGSCNENSNFQYEIWNETTIFADCFGDFRIHTYAKEFTNGYQTMMWKFEGKFKCDDKEFKMHGCQNGGGALVTITCTNDYTPDKVFSALIQELENSLDNDKLDKNLYQMYNTAREKLLKAGYGKEMELCQTWIQADSCRISFFKPIVGVIASYRTRKEGQPDINHGEVLDSWATKSWVDRDEWKHVKPDIANFMKKMLTRDTDEADIANILKREMIYTILHRKNKELFPWKDSRVNELAKAKWEPYARNANDQELRKILGTKISADVQEFCAEEQTKSPLCSFVAAKNKYDNSLLHFPEPCTNGNTALALQDQLKQKCSNIVSIQAYYGKNGQYTTFYDKLNEFLRDTDIQNAIGNLGEKLKTYFTELAKFDNAIAQADVGYLQSAIQKNTDRLKINAQNMKDLTAEITELKTTCAVLNIIEQILMLAVSIGVAIASGGAVPPNPKGIADVLDATKDAIQATKDTMTTITDIVAQSTVRNELGKLIGDAPTMMNTIVAKLEENKEKIDGMHKIVEAALNPEKTSLAAIKGPVDEFLKSYSDYTPGVTKTDIATLNQKYGAMLENFKKSFEGAGLLCSITGVSGKAAAKIGEAETVWVQINSLLEDIYGQQFELITALVKVIRSKLDQTAAKQLEADVNYNFEYIVGNMLTVRVAAQQVCDTYRYINNDIQDNNNCKDMSKQVFLLSSTRDRIKELDGNLQKVLQSYTTNPSIAWIPVNENHTKDTIRWDDLISGKDVEFTLPADNQDFLTKNGWSPAADQRMILPSFEPFIPDNVATTRNNGPVFVRFMVRAIQEIVTVNRNPTAQLYAIKSVEPLSARPEYKLNEQSCQHPKVENLFPNDRTMSSMYCIPKSNGNFGDGVNPTLPVSMYSKFQIRLTDGIVSDPNAIKNSRPVGDTLKIPVRIHVYDRGQGRQRTQKPTANLPTTEPCPEGQYRKIIDAKTQRCEPCPAGSVPKGQGSYCVRVAQ